MDRNQIDQTIRNSQDKKAKMGLLLEARKSLRTIDTLQWQIKYYKMVYPNKLGFSISEFERNMKEYIEDLEREVKEEKEFSDYVVREYCTNQDAGREAEGLSKDNISWN